LPTTLYNVIVMDSIVHDRDFEHFGGILHHGEGVDLMPSNIELADMEMTRVVAMSREYALSESLNRIKHEYDYIQKDLQDI
jgi:chromosome partitioning protein